MKSLSKLHQEAIIKARNATDQNKAAAMAMIEKPIEMIKAIMLKHELAVIEVMRELHESREAAVRAEREACAKVCEKLDQRDDIHPDHVALECAAAIRTRSMK
jgi:putative heme iron utilization protein